MDDHLGEDSDSPSEFSAPSRIELLLEQRQELTDSLARNPYDLIIYLRRAVVYGDLGYPDLAAGDAYRGLLLTDEILDECFEYHGRALEALQAYEKCLLPEVLNHGSLSSMVSDADSLDARLLATVSSVRALQMLSVSLLLCGCLKSAWTFTERGLRIAPGNQELVDAQGYIWTVARGRVRQDVKDPADLPDWGKARREVYPWNCHEPDRFSPESLDHLNRELAKIAPKACIQASTLPILLEEANSTDGYEYIPTCNQLGVFASQNIAPGEVVLREYSLVTANNRLKDSVCDACSGDLPPLGSDSPAVSCPECHDAVFCSQFCFDQALEHYHPAVCEKDLDAIAKDTDAKVADQALYLLLLSRVLAMAAHKESHPLQVNEIKYIWGDFVPSRFNEIDLSPNAGPPPRWTLPFSFYHNIEAPLHILEKMDKDIYAELAAYDIWVFNTLYGKFRGTASARKNSRDGRPEVAAVHPLWCLANHDCDPNVTWKWGGRMTFTAVDKRITGPAGVRRGEEILSHYCDITLPVHDRREWASGSLGGWCMCPRCRRETGRSTEAQGRHERRCVADEGPAQASVKVG